MSIDDLHPLLKRQLKKYLGVQGVVPAEIAPFAQSVNESYQLYEQSRELVERAMTLSSEELFEKNNLLELETQRQQKIIEQLKEAIQTLNPDTEINEDHNILKVIDLLQISLKERKQFEEELNLSKEKALKDLEIRKLFLANISHEIRTPINAISGMSGILADTQLSPSQTEYLDAIQSSSRNLMAIVNDILDMSKLESGKFSIEKISFNLRKLIEPICKVFGLKAEEKGVQLELDISPNVSNNLVGDPTRIAQIVNNLVSNATKFTEHGKINVRIYKEAKRTCFEVQDTGIGISEDKLKSIFEFFSQEDNTITRRFGGTGLGLAISKSLVEMMHGELSLTSEKGVGSKFTFKLELPEGEEEKLNLEKQGNTRLDNKRVLIVEDNELNLFLAVTVLKKSGAIIYTAENGQVAIDLLKEQRIDCILMDLQMPVLDGISATMQIRNELALTTPIIALTANALESEKKKCLELGMGAYITKPYDPTFLIQSISNLIEPKGQISNTEQISFAKLFEMVGDSVPQVIQLSKIFLEQFEQNCHAVERAIQSKDNDTLARIAHKMKPSFKLFNLNETAATCQKIEDAFQMNNFSTVQELSRQLLNNQFSIANQVQAALDKAYNKQTLQ
ncbi:MAG: Autoinducer 2 sensor kinase/phosphatase LuxQ [Bacteroidota bacterium]